MKAVTLINGFIMLFACIHIGVAIYNSYIINMRVRLRSVSYLMARDKMLFERFVRIAFFSILGVDLLLLSYVINRILLGFPAYFSEWAMISSMLLHLFMFMISSISMIVYRQGSFDLMLSVFSYFGGSSNHFIMFYVLEKVGTTAPEYLSGDPSQNGYSPQYSTDPAQAVWSTDIANIESLVNRFNITDAKPKEGTGNHPPKPPYIP